LASARAWPAEMPRVSASVAAAIIFIPVPQMRF
jgi:hypothetical protein